MNLTTRQIIDAINKQPRMHPAHRAGAVAAIVHAAPTKPLSKDDAKAALWENDIGAMVSGQADIDAPLDLDAGRMARILLNAVNFGRRSAK